MVLQSKYNLLPNRAKLNIIHEAIFQMSIRVAVNSAQNKPWSLIFNIHFKQTLIPMDFIQTVKHRNDFMLL